MLKSILKKIIHSTGYSIQIKKNNRNKKTIFTERNNPLYIEFIGPSCIGKSTLFNSIITAKRDWISIEEFLKLSLSKSQDLELSENDIYQKLAELRLKNLLNNNFTPLEKLKSGDFYYKKLIDDKLLNTKNKHYTILAEEGIIQSFSNELFELIYKTETHPSVFFRNRAIINFTASPAIIADRTIEREEKKKFRHNMHKNKTYAELVEIQKIELQKFQEIANQIKKWDVPVLEIKDIHSMDDKIKFINNFIHAIINSNYSTLKD